MGPRRLPKCILKSTKMDTWTSRCLLDVPVDPWITKMVTQDTKMEPRGLQNDSLGYKKLAISAVNKSAVNLSTAARGAGGRGEALR